MQSLGAFAEIAVSSSTNSSLRLLAEPIMIAGPCLAPSSPPETPIPTNSMDFDERIFPWFSLS